MNVLLVYAHPEPRSLNGSLKEFLPGRLEALGHVVQLSDLYAMRWKATADGEDFPGRDSSAKLDLVHDSKHAFESGVQSADIAAEQRKLLWADAVCSSPSIMGWSITPASTSSPRSWSTARFRWTRLGTRR